MTTGRPILVAQWSFSQLLWSSRTLAMGILASTPVWIALAFRGAVALEIAPPTSGFQVFSVVTATVCFAFVAPMLSLFYASGVTSDDVVKQLLDSIPTGGALYDGATAAAAS